MQMNQNRTSPTIEFLVDEGADVLLAYERSSQGASEGDLQEVLRLPLSDVRAREPAEMQRAVGRLVLSFLNSRSSKGLNLPRDLEDEKRLDEQHFGELQGRAAGNTPEAVYDLAVGLIGRGMSDGNWADIEEGEALLNQAVSAGFPAAVKYQAEVWTLVRPRLEQKLKRT
jgi:hypothetical protein